MIDANNYIGQQFGSYIITDLINSGGFGSVFKARHAYFEDDPIVAIKILHSHLTSPGERERFIKEAQLLRKLKHPHILAILDVGFQNYVPFMILEHAAGGSLQDRIEKQADLPLPIDEAIKILKQIGEALNYAHQHQPHIVHRDLKPKNILFNTNGDALLADFGIAVILETTGTQLFGNAGTALYKAPEQFKGLVSPKIDQYALGCIAYELVAGRRPYDLEGADAIVAEYQHAKVNPDAPTKYNPLLLPHTERAILKAMAKDRNNRHSDIATFLAALQKTASQWFKEGEAYYNLKQYEMVLEAYEQVTRLEPENSVAYNNKAAALYHLKQYEAAFDACEQAIFLNPYSARSYYLKSFILCDMEKYKEALEAIEQAIFLKPHYFSDASDKKKQVLRFLEKQVDMQ